MTGRVAYHSCTIYLGNAYYHNYLCCIDLRKFAANNSVFLSQILLQKVRPLLPSIAAAERATATDFVENLLPPDAKVSVYLYQPIAAAGLRAASPGVLHDIGPLPDPTGRVNRDLLYQCAEAGRTGSFLQSAEDCTRRVPQTTQIDDAASRSYRSFNGRADVCRAQIAVEQARHGFQSPRDDGPPVGWYIHHLALAPSVHSFAALSSGRIPVLGTIFTVTKHRRPVDRHEYSNLVDYAIFIAEEALEIRATHLLGKGHVGPSFEGSALEELLADPTCDAAVQLVVKLLFAHHWFFPYDAVAFSLLRRAVSSDAEVRDLYARHGWSAPRSLRPDARDEAALRRLVVADVVTLVRHLSWYRLGKDFRPRPGVVGDAVGRALNTALLLLCGARAFVPGYRTGRTYPRSRGGGVFLGASRALPGGEPNESLVAPVFAASGIDQLARGRPAALERFDPSFAVCGPGDTEGHTRTHLKPSRFVESFERGGAPRFSARMQDGVRERTKWLCSYAIARLVESSLRDKRTGERTDGP